MSSERLPREVDVKKFAERGVQLQGGIRQQQLDRVVDAVVDIVGDVEVKLQFAQGQRRQMRLSLTVQTSLRLNCQRCLADFVLPVSTASEFVFVADDIEARHFDEVGAEPILLDEGILDAYALVEEELLLALPIVPRHLDDDTACVQPGRNSQSENLHNGLAKSGAESAEGASFTRLGDNDFDRSVVRRSQIGESNPFESLKILKSNTGQE